MKRLSAQIAMCFFAFFLGLSTLHAQQFQWVHGGGTVYDFSSMSGSEETEFMCTDPNGNIYALNQVGNDPITADTFHATPYGDNFNILLTSYTCSGQIRWAKLIASSGEICTANGLIADSLGNIYVAGLFAGGGSGSTFHIGYDTTISSSSTADLTTGLIQFDTTGHFNWIRYVGPNSLAGAEAVGSAGDPLTIDGSNNTHYFCYIRTTGVTIAPGVTSVFGTYDFEYNSSGTLLSATRLQLDSTLMLSGATIDRESGKAYLFGSRNGSYWTDFGGDSSAYNFVAAFDPSGNKIWIDTIGDPEAVAEGLISGIVADGNGHLYLSAAGDGLLVYMGDSIKYPPTAVGGYIGTIMKTDTAGHMEWATQVDGNSGAGINSITLVAGNKIAAAGGFFELANSGPYTINAGVGSDPLFMVVDTSGALITLQRIHGSANNDGATAITSDKAGNIYIGGYVGNEIPDTLITPYVSVGGNTDFFILKYGVDCSCTSMPVANYTAIGAHTVSFTYTGTTAPTIDSVKWNFGDGDTSSLTNPTHTYTANGTYNACVMVYSACGSDMHCSDIVICATVPVASYTSTGTPTVNFTYTGTTAGIDSVVWNFGDGSATSTTTSPAHTYTATGTYSVCVTVYSACGDNTSCNTVVIPCTAAPAAYYTYAVTAPAVSFTYTGTTAGVDSVRWYFGDGGTSTATNPSYTYTASGTYSVCVTVYSACGSNTSCQDITISCVTPPLAAFTNTGTYTIDFTYMGTTAGTDSVSWSFGDGGTSTATNPIYTYTDIGTYSVCVTAYSDCGSSTACSTVTVTCIAPPAASFSDTGTNPLGFTYTGTTAGIDSVVWNFGDGSTGTGGTPVHTYSIADTYTVCVTVYTDCGADSACSSVVIVPTGIAWVSLINVQVFPNPTSDELNITGVQQSLNYRLLNVTGECMQRGILKQGSNALSMKKYAPGVYVLEMTRADGQRTMVRVVRD